MGFLKTNYDDVNAGFAPLPIAEYECFVSEAKLTKASTGSQMIKVTLTVRDDVEQAGGKRKFFDNMVVMDSMMWKFQQVSKAAQLPVGEDYDEAGFAAALVGKAVRIKNKHRVYEGETQDTIAWYTESKFGGSQDGDPFSGGGSIDISDDDLPF